MTLDPKIVQRLLSDVPEIVELREFLIQEAFKLNTLSGMESMTPEQRAIEVTARLRAKEAIDAMLAPLLAVQDKPVSGNPRDYLVEVGDLPGEK